MKLILDLLRRPFMAIDQEALRQLIALAVNDALEPFALSAAANHAGRTAPKGTLVIPVEGVLTASSAFWGTPYSELANSLDRSMSADVERVVLLVDSPGGSVQGLPEVAAQLAEVAKAKPVTAFVHGIAGSGAYWLAAQANRVVMTPSGSVGSIGVKATHMDLSKMLTDMGINVTEMFAGEHKTEFSPFAPLSDDSKAYMQTLLDGMHGQFMSAVKSGRAGKYPAEFEASQFGGGRMFMGPEAKANGMVDELQSAPAFWKALMPEGTDPATRRVRVDIKKNAY